MSSAMVSLLLLALCGAGGVGRHAPDGAADIVGNQQRAVAIHRDADRAAVRVALRIEETRDEVERLSDRPSAGKADEHNPVAVQISAVPAAVLAHEGAAPE